MAHPQGNGQAEAANEFVLMTLKKNLEGKFTNWVEALLVALWVVRTSTRGHTGDTPYA